MRLGWRIALTLLLLLGLCLLGLFRSPQPRAAAAPLAKALANVQSAVQAQSSSDPLVLAFYYTWFDETTWTYDKLSDLPAQQYASRDRAAMGRHIDEAQRAGIDAFVVAWYGPHENQTEPNLAALLEEASVRNFKIAILFETDSPFLGGIGDITGALQHAAAVHMSHPAYLRVDGQPVLFFWRPHIYDVGTWQGVRAQADPNYGQIWISEGVNTQFLAVFDGHHLYSNTWNPPADLTYTNQKFADRVQEARNKFGVRKFWVATVMPGYDDTRIRPGYGFAKDREGGAYYERSWQAAMASSPNWIVINSFNEWPEGTYIEPSAAHGDRYIQLTATWSGQFKSGGPRNISVPESAPTAPPTQPAPTQPEPAQPEPAPAPAPAAPPPPPTTVDGPTAYVTATLLNVRAGPSTATALLTQVPQGTTLPIVAAQPDWWQITWDGQYGWVYAPLVRALGVSADTVPGLGQLQAPGAAGAAISVAEATVPARGDSPTAIVRVALLNLRGSPSTEAPILSRVVEGTVLSVTGMDPQRPSWVQVDAGVKNGWVYAEMVDLNGSMDQIPEVRAE
jgi:uncharacterized protein YraI